ncbi:MAG: OmpA family protein [Methanosarcina sp.]|nr:OmpA family protein [Methanosarcina sp.]
MSGTGTPTPIIIKKVKKGGHSGAHGGSWKVAYADFVTAMMAFFLLLWLISMVSDEKKARVSQYFKEFSLFEKGGQSFMMDNRISDNQIEIIDGGESNDSKSEDAKSDQKEKNTKASKDFKDFNVFNKDGHSFIMDKQASENQIELIDSGKTGENTPEGDGDSTENTAAEMADDIKEIIKKEVEAKLSSLKDQIIVDSDDGASRIEIIDKKGGIIMFASGSKEITPDGKKALDIVAESLKGVKGKIAIEGHTDSLKYAGTQYGNWELSTERAAAARKELESCGISSDRFIRVAGYADTDPLIKEDTLDPRNRRISIRVFPEKQPDSPSPADESHSSQNPVKKGNKSKNRTNKNQNNDDLEPIGRYLQKK